VPDRPDVPTLLTAGTLASVGALHVAWGTGATFPFADAAELADAVAGTPAVPSPVACYTVASLLGVAAAVTAGAPRPDALGRRLAVVGVAVVLGVRAAAGLMGRTDALVGWPTGERFRRNDRRYFAPLCGVLAAGAAWSLRGARRS
jgi:hypothetical protein